MATHQILLVEPPLVIAEEGIAAVQAYFISIQSLIRKETTDVSN